MRFPGAEKGGVSVLHVPDRVISPVLPARVSSTIPVSEGRVLASAVRAGMDVSTPATRGNAAEGRMASDDSRWQRVPGRPLTLP